MKWHRKKLFILGFLSTLIFLLSGTAWAQTEIKDKALVKIGGDVTVAERQVVGEVTAIGGSVTIMTAGRVKGDAIAIGGDVLLQAGARVDGDAVALGGEIIKAQDATIVGQEVTGSKETRDTIYTIRRWGIGGLLARIYLASVIVHVLVILVIAAIGALLLLLVPNFVETITNTIHQLPLKSGTWGLGGVLAALVVSALVSGSVLGALFLPILNLAVLFVGLVGTVAMGLLIGRRIVTAGARSPNLQFLVGIVILGLIGLIPFVGGLVLLIVNLFGIGGVLLSQLARLKPQILGETNTSTELIRDRREEIRR